MIWVILAWLAFGVGMGALDHFWGKRSANRSH